MTATVRKWDGTLQQNAGRVLVVDDEPEVLAALSDALSRSGFEVSAVADAEAALNALQRDPPDLLVTDVILPGGNGVELIKVVRVRFPSIRVIAISGGGGFGNDNYQPSSISTQAYLAASREAGAHAALAKPFGLEEILGAARRLPAFAPH